jgi:hypothetical protein
MALEAMGTDRVSVTFSVRMGARMLDCGLEQITSLLSCCAALGMILLIDYHGGNADVVGLC